MRRHGLGASVLVEAASWSPSELAQGLARAAREYNAMPAAPAEQKRLAKVRVEQLRGRARSVTMRAGPSPAEKRDLQSALRYADAVLAAQAAGKRHGVTGKGGVKARAPVSGGTGVTSARPLPRTQAQALQQQLMAAAETAKRQAQAAGLVTPTGRLTAQGQALVQAKQQQAAQQAAEQIATVAAEQAADAGASPGEQAAVAQDAAAAAIDEAAKITSDAEQAAAGATAAEAAATVAAGGAAAPPPPGERVAPEEVGVLGWLWPGGKPIYKRPGLWLVLGVIGGGLALGASAKEK